jgi:hypothetical protein
MILHLALYNTTRKELGMFDLYQNGNCIENSTAVRSLCGIHTNAADAVFFFVRATTNRQSEHCYPTAQLMVRGDARRSHM